MKDVDFDKICCDVLDALKSENPQGEVDSKKSNLVDAFQKSSVYVCVEVLKRYHAALNEN